MGHGAIQVQVARHRQVVTGTVDATGQVHLAGRQGRVRTQADVTVVGLAARGAHAAAVDGGLLRQHRQIGGTGHGVIEAHRRARQSDRSVQDQVIAIHLNASGGHVRTEYRAAARIGRQRSCVHLSIERHRALAVHSQIRLDTGHAAFQRQIATDRRDQDLVAHQGDRTREGVVTTAVLQRTRSIASTRAGQGDVFCNRHTTRQRQGAASQHRRVTFGAAQRVVAGSGQGGPFFNRGGTAVAVVARQRQITPGQDQTARA